MTVATETIQTQTVTLHFQVPEGLDLPSEVKAAMKQLLLDCLARQRSSWTITPDQRPLMDALLTEC